MFLIQLRYIQELLNEVEIECVKAYPTPLVVGKKLSKEEGEIM